MISHELKSGIVLGPAELATISQAYDLALLQIADEGLAFDDASSSEIKARLNLAIFAAAKSGVSDIQVLKIFGISAVTTRSEFQNPVLNDYPPVASA